MGAPIAGAEEPAGVVVEAERIELVEERVHARGDVVLGLGGDRIEAAEVELDGGRAVLRDGTWTRAGLGTVRFELAEVDLGGRSGVVRGGELIAGELVVRGERLELLVDGSLRGEELTWSTCGCEGPWSVSAQQAQVRLDEGVGFRRGWIRVLDVPILPVPVGYVPLERRSGLLPPEVGHGVDGLRVGLPVYLTLGRSADLTLTPEVRTGRSVRVGTEARWAQRDGRGWVEATFGHDWVERTARGAARWDQRWARGGFTASTTGQLLGDPDYLRDYRDEHLARGAPWTEARALVGWAPLEVGLDVYQAGAMGTGQEQLRVGLHRPAVDLPLGVLGSARAGGEWTWGGTGDGDGSAWAQARAERTSWLGPIRATPALEASASGAIGGSQDSVGRAEIEVALPAWRTRVRAVERLEPRIRAGGGWSTLGSPWTAAPGLVWRRVGEDGLAELGAEAVLSEDGWGLRADAWLVSGPWSGWAQAWTSVPDLAEGTGRLGVAFDDGRLRLATTWVHAPHTFHREGARRLHQVRAHLGWTLPGPLGSFRPWIDGVLDLEGGGWVGRGGGLRYTHPSGCLSLAALLRLDSDRAGPDLGLQVRVQ